MLDTADPEDDTALTLKKCTVYLMGTGGKESLAYLEVGVRGEGRRVGE